MLIAALALALPAPVADAQPAASGDGSAQAATTQPAAPVRTSKERLGNKWSDEQRVDNCKVSPERRGPRPRPERCAPAAK